MQPKRYKERPNEVCPVCHSGFYVPPSRRAKMEKKGRIVCCSKQCQRELEKRCKETHCPQCGKKFVPRTGQIYCSKSCGSIALHARRGNTLSDGAELKECPVCHTKYEKGHGAYTCDAYCSIRCHATARDARRPPTQRKLTPDPFTYDIPRDPVRPVNPHLGY